MTSRFAFLCYFFSFVFLFVGMLGIRANVKEMSQQIKALSKELKAATKNFDSQWKSKDEKVEDIITRQSWIKCMMFQTRRNCHAGNASDSDLPPCVADVLKNMLDALSSQMTKSAWKHFVTYRTLLDAVRIGEIGANVTSIEMTVDRPKTLKKVPKLIKLKQKGYHIFLDTSVSAKVCIEDSPEKPLYKKYERWRIESIDPLEYRYAEHFPHGTIYVNAKKPGNNYSTPLGPDCLVSGDVLFPTTKLQMYNREYSAPANITQFLWRAYGADYLEPSFQVPTTWNSACLIKNDTDVELWRKGILKFEEPPD